MTKGLHEPFRIDAYTSHKRHAWQFAYGFCISEGERHNPKKTVIRSQEQLPAAPSNRRLDNGSAFRISLWMQANKKVMDRRILVAPDGDCCPKMAHLTHFLLITLDIAMHKPAAIISGKPCGRKNKT